MTNKCKNYSKYSHPHPWIMIIPLCNSYIRTLVCLIDEQGLISAQGGKKIKKLINAQGLIIIILYCLIRAHRVDFFPKKISTHVRLLGRPEYLNSR